MDDRLEAGYRGAKAIQVPVKMVKQRYNLGAISPRKAKEDTNRGVEAYEELKEMYGRENIISAVIT